MDFRNILKPVAYSVLAVAMSASASAQSQRPVDDLLEAIAQRTGMPTNVRLIERVNDLTLGELGLCEGNYVANRNELEPGWRQHNLDLDDVLAADAIVRALPQETYDYLRAQLGPNLDLIEQIDVNRHGTDPNADHRLIVSVGIGARAHNVTTDLGGLTVDRFGNETDAIELSGIHARNLLETIDRVCETTRWGELKSISGDEYALVLRYAIDGFERLSNERPDQAHVPQRNDLESRIALDIDFFEPGDRVTYETFFGTYTAGIVHSDAGRELRIVGDDGSYSAIRIHDDIRLAISVDDLDGVDDTYRSGIYANESGPRFSLLAVSRADSIEAHQPYGLVERFAERAGGATKPFSFEGTHDGSDVNVAIVTYGLDEVVDLYAK